MVERDGSNGRHLKAFAFVPFVAAAVWYVLMLVVLLLANGRLRLMTDVMAMALGGVIVGLPVAGLITLVLAIPGYFLVRATVGVSLASAVIAGASIGVLASAGFWMWAHEWTIISPLRAVLIGATSGAGWWRLAGRPGVARQRT